MRNEPAAEGARWPVALVAAVTLAAAVAALATGGERRAARPLEPLVIDLDRADAVELDLLPGIGPALAARIVADRATRGPFRSPEALDRVPGIGPATVEAVRPFVHAGGTANRDDG